MKPIANSIGVVKLTEPPHIVPIQLKIFTPVGTAISIVLEAKTASAIGPRPTANMWCAHTPKARKPIAIARVDHDRVAEERLAREDRDDLGDDAHRGQDQDVHLGVAEDPEQVLPEERVAAVRARCRSWCRRSGRTSAGSGRR